MFFEYLCKIAILYSRQNTSGIEGKNIIIYLIFVEIHKNRTNFFMLSMYKVCKLHLKIENLPDIMFLAY